MSRAQQLYVNMPSSKRRPVKLHAGWLEHKSSQDSKWKWFWCSLRGNVIYIFKNQTDSHDQHIGTLTVDAAARFEKKDGDTKTGYKFDLNTGRRSNKFRTKKFSDRELWKAYVDGLSRGSVPDNIDLPENLIDDIREALKTPFTEEQTEMKRAQSQRRKSVDITSGRTSQEGFDQPESPSSGTLHNAKFNTLHVEYLQPTRQPLPIQSPPPPPSTTIDNAINHVFYSDSSNKDIPNWFFKDCSRELAMEILSKATKEDMGNTLMRSRPETNQQNLVISKMMEKGGSHEFSHYEIRSVQGGYVIVLDDPHPPLQSLDDLMNFFKLRSGTITTKLMTCNNLKKIINPQSDYERSIPKVQFDDESGEHSVVSMEEDLLNDLEMLPLYLNTSSPPSSKGSSSEGSFSSMSISTTSSQQSIPAPPTPPPLPPNHPPPLRKPIPNVNRANSISQSSTKPAPRTLPKPTKAASFDEGTKSTDHHEFSRRLEADDNCTVVYADIKKSISFESSLNGSFEYINCKAENNALSNRCQSQEDLITYIEMNHKCVLLNQDHYEQTYEPIDNVHQFNRGCSFKDLNCNNKLNDNSEKSFKKSVKQPELLKTVTSVSTDKANYENAVDDEECDIFQEINFHQSQSEHKDIEPDSRNEESDCASDERYELFGDKICSEKNAPSIILSHRKVFDDVVMKVGNCGTKAEKIREENEYETIHFKTSKSALKLHCARGISTPEEMYEGLEYKYELMQRPRAPSPAFQREQNRNVFEQQSHRISSNPDIKNAHLDQIYEEVQQIFSEDPSINNSAYYIDIIASYEDIKAMKLSTKRSVHSSTCKNKGKNILKQRSKSEISFSALNGNNAGSCASMDFMTELQNVLKGQGALKKISSNNQEQQTPLPNDTYFNPDVYE